MPPRHERRRCTQGHVSDSTDHLTLAGASLRALDYEHWSRAHERPFQCSEHCSKNEQRPCLRVLERVMLKWLQESLHGSLCVLGGGRSWERQIRRAISKNAGLRIIPNLVSDTAVVAHEWNARNSYERACTVPTAPLRDVVRAKIAGWFAPLVAPALRRPHPCQAFCALNNVGREHYRRGREIAAPSLKFVRSLIGHTQDD
jgi:hypothetical protein